MAEMAENGRKWPKMDFRGYLVGNGFPRVLRHSPTTTNKQIELPNLLLLVFFVIIECETEYNVTSIGSRLVICPIYTFLLFSLRMQQTPFLQWEIHS